MHLFCRCRFPKQLSLVTNQTSAFLIFYARNNSATSALSVSFQRTYSTTVKMTDSSNEILLNYHFFRTRMCLTISFHVVKQSLVAIAQMTATSDKAENFAITKKQIQEASTLGAKVLNK